MSAALFNIASGSMSKRPRFATQKTRMGAGSPPGDPGRPRLLLCGVRAVTPGRP
jgi:hypothetical protein